MKEKFVIVMRQPNDYKKAKVKFEHLRNVYWSNTSGGVHARASQDGLYGYIYCNQIIEGEVSHSCTHGDAPHNIKVYIPIKYNDKNIIKELKEIADKKGKRHTIDRAINVSDKIREIVAKNPGIIPAEIYPLIPNCSKERIDNSIRYLKKHSFKNKAILTSEAYKNTQKLYIKHLSDN